MKVLHCPDGIGGHPGQLAKAERAIGLDSKLIVFQQSYLKYQADEVLLDENAGILRRELARWKLLFRALKYDVIHYNFGQTIMPSRLTLHGRAARRCPAWLRWFYGAYVAMVEFLDVRLLKWLGKVIVVTFQGDDVRQGDYCRTHFELTFANEVEDGYYSETTDCLKRDRIRMFDRYADCIYALNPDLLHVLPPRAVFLPYASVDLDAWRPVESRNSKLVVLHAPTHRKVKGTKYLLEAAKRLRDEEVDFELVLVEGMSNEEAKIQYARADLLVDQLLAGWYGGLAVELMAMGKPVMSYIREEDLGCLPEGMRSELPIISVTPESLYGELKHWLTEGRARLSEQGKRSRDFVERWHDPLKIARRLKQDYESALLVEGEMR